MSNPLKKLNNTSISTPVQTVPKNEQYPENKTLQNVSPIIIPDSNSTIFSFDEYEHNDINFLKSPSHTIHGVDIDKLHSELFDYKTLTHFDFDLSHDTQQKEEKEKKDQSMQEYVNIPWTTTITDEENLYRPKKRQKRTMTSNTIQDVISDNFNYMISKPYDYFRRWAWFVVYDHAYDKVKEEVYKRFSNINTRQQIISKIRVDAILRNKYDLFSYHDVVNKQWIEAMTSLKDTYDDMETHMFVESFLKITDLKLLDAKWRKFVSFNLVRDSDCPAVQEETDGSTYIRYSTNKQLIEKICQKDFPAPFEPWISRFITTTQERTELRNKSNKSLSLKAEKTLDLNGRMAPYIYYKLIVEGVGQEKPWWTKLFMLLFCCGRRKAALISHVGMFSQSEKGPFWMKVLRDVKDRDTEFKSYHCPILIPYKLFKQELEYLREKLRILYKIDTTTSATDASRKITTQAGRLWRAWLIKHEVVKDLCEFGVKRHSKATGVQDNACLHWCRAAYVYTVLRNFHPIPNIVLFASKILGHSGDTPGSVLAHYLTHPIRGGPFELFGITEELRALPPLLEDMPADPQPMLGENIEQLLKETDPKKIKQLNK